jgi:superfamily II DNA/RNA helicase
MSDLSFRALGVSSELADALSARGIESPFPIQARAIPEALTGRDILAKSPTGSGKTLAFGLPLIQRTKPGDASPAALVLVPTRELAQQVVAELAPLAGAEGLRVEAAYGGAPVAAQAKRIRGAHILVATPGRLHDFVQRRLVSPANTRALVLDEADRMLDMGFRPQVERIVSKLPRDRQTMLFSATLDGDVADLARAYTHDPARVAAGPLVEDDAASVDHRFVAVTAADRLDHLVEHLESDRDLALVFVRTKRGAARLAQKLEARGIAAAALHGDMPQRARDRALDRFRTGKVTTLVATDVAARGLDLDDITHVINYDAPEDQKAYVHRVGRTGRAGRSGTGITFVLPEQETDVSRVAAALGHRERFEESGLKTARPRLVYTSSRGRRSRW